jgi:hypothetical protein
MNDTQVNAAGNGDGDNSQGDDIENNKKPIYRGMIFCPTMRSAQHKAIGGLIYLLGAFEDKEAGERAASAEIKKGKAWGYDATSYGWVRAAPGRGVSLWGHATFQPLVFVIQVQATPDYHQGNEWSYGYAFEDPSEAEVHLAELRKSVEVESAELYSIPLYRKAAS